MGRELSTDLEHAQRNLSLTCNLENMKSLDAQKMLCNILCGETAVMAPPEQSRLCFMKLAQADTT